jgi:hypothetical protein
VGSLSSFPQVFNRSPEIANPKETDDQVMGGIGYTDIFPVERIFRDLRLLSIFSRRLTLDA